MASTSRRLLGAAAITAAVAGGGLAGALVGVAGVSGAQEPGTTTTTAPADEGAARPGAGRPFEPLVDLGVAAEAIGVTEDELLDALRDGRSIADVAEDEGVAVQDVVDALVADASTALPDRVAALVEGEGLPFGRPGRPGNRGGPGGPGHHGPPLVDLDVAADALGTTDDELLDALRDGRSVAEVAEEEGVELQEVVDALVADATAEIDDRLADGDLDAEQAADLKAALPDRVAAFVEMTGFPGHGRGHGPGRGPRPGPGPMGGQDD